VVPWRPFTGLFLALVLQLAVCGAAAGVEPGQNQLISSSRLGYDLQYRVYAPDEVATGDTLPSLYVTDGQWYLHNGELAQLIDEMIRDERIKPLVAVFVDSRNPGNLVENRRTSEFMCNREYAAFFASELVPAISAAYPVSASREDRVVLGMSFGGLNAACFGILLPEVFGGIAMQSPASEDHVDVVRELYQQSPKLPLTMFLSVGTENDNLRAVKRFRRTLEDKGYDLTYEKVRQGHTWRNWKPLLDDVLLTFFAQESANR
jgi:enterochelin esterase-like enzyme